MMPSKIFSAASLNPKDGVPAYVNLDKLNAVHSFFPEFSMQNTIKLALLATVLGLSVVFNAAASSYPARIGAKLGTGIANATTGIVEIPRTIRIANRLEGPAYAASAGLMTGIVHMLGRTLSGTLDLLTFMIPTKPIVKPDYVWQDFSKETTYRSTWELR